MGDSLRSIVSNRVLAAIREVQSPWKVLVVDSVSVRVIGAACSMYDITEEGISLVENIELNREPMAEMEAIYFVSPTYASMKRICDDFANPRDPKYDAAHIFLTSHISDEVLFPVKNCAGLRRYLKTLKELNIEFLASEAQAFSLDVPEALHLLAGVADSKPRAALQMTIAQRMVTLFVTLGMRPEVRYCATRSSLSTAEQESNKLLHLDSCEGIARALEQALDRVEKQAVRTGVQLWRRSTHPCRLVIVDRAWDPLTPLLHDFHYQAMTHDVLEVRGDRYTHRYVSNEGKATEKEVVLNEADALWPRLRHQHVAEAIDMLIADFQEFMDQNHVAGLQKGQVGDLKHMAEAIKNMPQYQELMARYSLHMDVTKSCMARFNASKLEDVAEVQQSLATGSSSDGKKVKKAQMLAAVSALLRDPLVHDGDKLRLILAYLLTNEEASSPARQAAGLSLLREARLEHCDRAVRNLDLLGPCPPRQSPAASGIASVFGIKRKSKSSARADDVFFELSRHQAPLKWVMQDGLKGSLSPTIFPHVHANGGAGGGGGGLQREGDAGRGGASADKAVEDMLATAKSVRSRPRSSASRAREGAGGGAGREQRDLHVTESKSLIDSGPVLVVLVSGGVTHAEMRHAYAVSRAQQRLVLIGGTEIMGPRAYVADLLSLHDPALHDAAQILKAREATSESLVW